MKTNNENKKMKMSHEGVYQSGIKGITWEKNIDTWRASISVNGKCYTLGFNPNMYELIPIIERAKAAKEEGYEKFIDFYENELGLEKRVCTPSPLQSDVVGVSFNARTNKWTAAISIENRKYILYTTEVQEDAESIRHSADKLKEKCENTPTEDGIIDYTPFYNWLAELKIEKQKSKLDARIGTGHGKKAWRRLKKEENKLDALLVKSLKGDLQKELRDYKKEDKNNSVVSLKEYPTIKYLHANYYVFIELDGKEVFIGKKMDILQAILLFNMGTSIANSDYWLDWFSNIKMGLEPPTKEDLFGYFGLSSERYDKLKSISSNVSAYGIAPCKKETIKESANVYSRDYRNVTPKNKTAKRLVFMGCTILNVNTLKFPLKGFSMYLENDEKSSLTNEMIEDLYDIDEALNHVESGDFYNWYLFESGLFEEIA